MINFQYARATDVADAVRQIAADPAAKVIAGGTNLLDLMKYDVERPARVVVEALDREGKPFTIEASELLARCLQHEIDHLHGKLFIDYLSVLKRRSAIAKWEGMKKDYPNLLRIVANETRGEHHHDGEL